MGSRSCHVVEQQIHLLELLRVAAKSALIAPASGYRPVGTTGAGGLPPASRAPFLAIPRGACQHHRPARLMEPERRLPGRPRSPRLSPPPLTPFTDDDCRFRMPANATPARVGSVDRGKGPSATDLTDTHNAVHATAVSDTLAIPLIATVPPGRAWHTTRHQRAIRAARPRYYAAASARAAGPLLRFLAISVTCPAPTLRSAVSRRQPVHARRGSGGLLPDALSLWTGRLVLPLPSAGYWLPE